MVSIDIDAVGRVIRDVAAREIMPRWRMLAPGDISQKSGPFDLVTIADTATEQALARELESAYPSTTVTGEETFAADPAALDRLTGQHFVWIVDPIDGTRAFSEGRDAFAVMVALVHHKVPVAAWIYQPVNDTLYCAERGSGVFRVSGQANRQRLQPSAPSDLKHMAGIMSGNIAFGGQAVTREGKRHHFRSLERMACPGHDYPRILEGQVHFSAYSRCMPWDHLPGAMLMGEAGWYSAQLDRSPYLATDMTGGVMSAPSREAWEAIWEVMASS
jgi:fructose-1,6-bisphosphatase/inositol monophosphatase family enzyme